MTRYGFTVSTARPVDEPALAEALQAGGYDDAWSAELNGADGVTPLAVLAERAPSLRLGTAVLPVHTRGPALLAQTAATMAGLAPGRFVLGIGASSPAIVSDWNGQAHDRPFHRTRDVLRFLKRALAGERVTAEFDTFSVSRFQLAFPPAEPPPVFLAALREGMLRLAGREADGVILNWLGAGDVPRLRGVVEDAAGSRTCEVAGRVFVVLDADAARARAVGRRAIAAYLNVPAYAAFHDWLGRGPVLAPMWEAWRAGDRRGALAAIPDEVVDDLVVHGDATACRQALARYAASGLDTVIAMLLDPGADPVEAAQRLAPAAIR